MITEREVRQLTHPATWCRIEPPRRYKPPITPDTRKVMDFVAATTRPFTTSAVCRACGFSCSSFVSKILHAMYLRDELEKAGLIQIRQGTSQAVVGAAVKGKNPGPIARAVLALEVDQGFIVRSKTELNTAWAAAYRSGIRLSQSILTNRAGWRVERVA